MWIGLLPLLAGAATILYSTGIFQAADSNFNGPRWMGALFGVTFFGAGLLVSLADERFKYFHTDWWFKLLMLFSGLTFPLSFVIMFNWVAFGPGEREFSGGISIPFLSVNFSNANEIIGRIVFGIPSLLMDLFLISAVLGVVYEAVKAWVNEGEE